MKVDRTKMLEALRRVVQRMHYPLEVMLVCVRWYAAYPLSFRNIEEMMAERGVFVDHSTLVDQDAAGAGGRVPSAQAPSRPELEDGRDLREDQRGSGSTCTGQLIATATPSTSFCVPSETMLLHEHSSNAPLTCTACPRRSR